MTLCAFFMMFDFVDSFCATGLSGVQVPAVVETAPPELVVPEPDVVVDAVVVVPDVVDVVVVALPLVFAAAEFPFGVVDFANFVDAPFELVVVAADEPFT
ncbi:MAG: hypothetical protein EHM89_18215, partial [Acidobacteria bacterium]